MTAARVRASPVLQVVQLVYNCGTAGLALSEMAYQRQGIDKMADSYLVYPHADKHPYSPVAVDFELELDSRSDDSCQHSELEFFEALAHWKIAVFAVESGHQPVDCVVARFAYCRHPV